MDFVKNVLSSALGIALAALVAIVIKGKPTESENLQRRLQYLFWGNPNPLKIKWQYSVKVEDKSFEVFKVSFITMKGDEDFNTLTCNYPLEEVKYDRSWDMLHGIKVLLSPRGSTEKSIPVTVTLALNSCTVPRHFFVAVNVPKGKKVVKFKLSGTHLIPSKKGKFILKETT